MWTIMMSAWHHFRIGKKGTLSESARFRYNSFVQSFAVDFPGRYRVLHVCSPTLRNHHCKPAGRSMGRVFGTLALCHCRKGFSCGIDPAV